MPFLVVEYKQKTTIKRGLIKRGLWQNFQQMRNTAIRYDVPEIHGLLTNYDEWRFSRYSLRQERALGAQNASKCFVAAFPIRLGSLESWMRLVGTLASLA